jgi:CheY-like chemotaxis protein
MRDRGSGMDEETRSRALEPFFTTKVTGQGTGLGLAQVFGVVTQSGGSMTIDSVPGVGTQVILRLPECEEQEATEVAKAAPVAAVQSLGMLVVDDDPAVRASIAGLLMEEGHSVEAVGSGVGALALIRETAFDLIVVDFLMPNMTGAELIKAAREVRKDARFLLVSGYSDSEEIAAATGDVILLRKPFTSDELRLAVARSVSVSSPGG